MVRIKGRVRLFGNNIDTDTITPAAYLHLPVSELVEYAFSPIAPGFSRTVKKDDIIVAGDNYGCGSSREAATEVIKLMGIKYIVCRSMARIYYRNCIAIGISPILSKEITGLFNEGDSIEIDNDLNIINNLCTGKMAAFQPIPEAIKPILAAGGILELLKRRYSR